MHGLTHLEEGASIFDAYADVLSNVANCHFERTFDKIFEHCATSDDICGRPHQFENFAKHHVELITRGDAVLTDMHDEIKSVWPAADEDQFEGQMKHIGKFCAELIMVILGFEQ